MNGFVHLHVHSEYSLLDGAARTEKLAEQAARLGMSALALTDHGVMYGAIPFYKACKAHGIKPIIGCEMYVTTGSRLTKASRQEQPTHHLILLAKNKTGYRNLMRLCSDAHLRGFHYKPRTDHEQLAAHAEGLVCLSSCLGSEISQHLLYDRHEEAKAAALRFRGMFGDDFYLEIQDHGMLEQKKVMQAMIALSRETGIPLVATNDVHYVHAEDHVMQDVLICIGTGKTVDDPDRLKFHTEQMYLKSPEEMARLYAHVPEALDNTVRIAEKCALELEFGRSILPEYRPIPDGLTAGRYLRKLCEEGLERRYAGLPEWSDPDYRTKLDDRLRYELDVIGNMGYSDYFLIVWDFIRFAHENGIVTGPGRGSSAGSLVAYVLCITDVDPIKYGLLFERFLNPERVTMPDIDIDFSDERRDEVIDYVVDKYGAEHVAQIITFGTMAAKAAVRDVGRVLNMPYHEVDRVAKMIPNQLGVTIEDALRLNPDLKELYGKHEPTARLVDMAMKVEGLPRHASTHAAGVVISREPLTEYVPLQEGTGSVTLTQYSMEHLESIGLLKMDFLGLRYLSIIERTLRWTEEQLGERIDFQRVSIEDPATYELLSRGDTTGIFQLESPGMRRVLKELKPSKFEDIISVNALYRPGPMEFIPKYIQAKHGAVKVEYPHPSLEPILGDTYGIIVYQEQIMQIASKMAGFRLGEADLLRRAVSKKKREVLDEQRAHFVAGSLKMGYSEDDANKVYDMIVRFADYGFPRAHATAYGVLAFQTAYLKTHYPVPFMASMLASVMGSHRKVAEYVDECRKMGIEVLPPDVNESGVQFTPRGKAIRFGLAAIKNVGTHAMESIIREREERPYANLLDFCRRVDLRVCNKRVIESLIQGGAMDSLPGHRAQHIAVLDETVEAAQKWKKEREDLQLHLFGFTEETNWTIEMPDVQPYSPMQKLEFERELLGLYLSGHPLDEYEPLIEELDADLLHELADYPDNADVLVAGMVLSGKPILTKKGLPMGFMELENRIAKVEVVLFPEVWKQASALVQKGNALLVKARLQHHDEDVKLLADRVLALGAPDAAAQARAWKSAPRGRAGGAPAPARGEARRDAPGAPARAAVPAAAGAGPRAAAAGRATPSTPAAARPAQASAPRPAREPAQRPAPAASRAEPAAAGGAGRAQRLFVKIAADREQPQRLVQLQALLQRHAGTMPVVLFYERDQRLLALSDAYNVKPSPELIRGIGEIMGQDSARVK
ncbi:DNA polymerase III subunit alpha [Paenibacillus flagellatus]|uniref:DNA-directed DNA polymerase n=1 Tax=Paenibacillus flagellatus TaxID=2211139 RepID=A0A2V5KBW2_9BACL|nr:DNA polymerase III subunit alpha [Paenibacillus flagellatus]PYI57069.1 DNA polymerase III subunit alpha [Paenibacillus flagellatus]